VTVLILGVVAWFLQLAAIVLPQWRVDWSGSYGYGHRRSWGLFVVVGKKMQSWQAYQSFACRYWGQLRVFNDCQSPICKWYETKCRVYIDMQIVNYSVGFLFVLELIVHLVCLGLTARLTSRSLRWASSWWVVVAIAHVIAFGSHYFLMEELFADLNKESFYPDPSFGLSFVFSVVALFCLCWVVLGASNLSSKWPEEGFQEDWDGSPFETNAFRQPQQLDPCLENFAGVPHLSPQREIAQPFQDYSVQQQEGHTLYHQQPRDDPFMQPVQRPQGPQDPQFYPDSGPRMCGQRAW